MTNTLKWGKTWGEVDRNEDDKRTQAEQIVGWIAPKLPVDLVDELVRGLGLLACLLVAVFVYLRVADAGLHGARAGVGFPGIVVGHTVGCWVCSGIGMVVDLLCGCLLGTVVGCL